MSSPSKFNKRQRGFTLLELLVAMTIFSIVMVGLASMFTVLSTTAKDQKQQALLSNETQKAAQLLDVDIRQTGFLLASGSNNTLPLFQEAGHPVAAVQILDSGKTLRCYRLGDESGGRVVEGVTPAGAVTDATTELTIGGNTQSLASRIGAGRAFLFVSQGTGRIGKLFITDTQLTQDSIQANLVHAHGAFTTASCLNVGPIDATTSDYRGLVAVPVTAFIEYRFEEEGLVRYEFLGSANPCSATPGGQRRLLIERNHYSDGSFGYLLNSGSRVFPLPDTDFVNLKGVMLSLKRQTQSASRAEFTAINLPFTLNDQW